LKLIIGSLVVFSLVIVFLFALFPAELSVSRVVLIKSSSQKVHHRLADLREWNWNEFVYDAFPAHFLPTYGDGQIDSSYIHLRNVSIDLVRDQKDTITTRWQHGTKSFMSDFILSPQPDGSTVVEWTLHFHPGWYPWEKLASMFYNKQLGPMMEKSMVNLQRDLEPSSN
jgi:hypothetical protein